MAEAFFKLITDIARAEIGEKNNITMGKIVKSYPNDKYDVQIGSTFVSRIGIIKPGGVEREIVSFGNINRSIYYKNLYRVGDLVKIVKIDGDNNKMGIEGKVEFNTNLLPTRTI